jgi:asparagine synthase (glutamine-hydrolysing)
MCGIAGSFSFRNDAQPLDLDLIQHRGPDSRGEWTSPDRRVWLGMTRLAILDLSPAGNQPMIDPITGNVIIHNGEIYNHLSVRPELERLGARFFGTSDTETLLAAYRHWGEAMLPRVKGMFAFAIYDNADGSILLARDRFGIKPLYFYSGQDEFVFASEVRGIVQKKGLRPTRDSIVAYLQWGSCPHSRLLFPDVAEFPVGSYVRVTREGPTTPVGFWPRSRFETTSNQPANGLAVVRRTRELLEKSVSEHILSDVPVACFLSGGVDSSVITALAARQLHRELHTFSVGFDEASHDESVYARRIAAQYDTDHTEIRLAAEEVIETTKQAVLSMDLPSVDGINSYIVAKQVAGRGFKVALAGTGGDELFGGYSPFRFLSRLKYLALVPRLVFDLPLKLKKGCHLFSDVPLRPDAGVFAQWWRRIWNGALLREFGFSSPEVANEPTPELQDDFARISWSELRHYMRNVLLRDSDQMSMAVSLEVRVPFLDHELVEFVLALPAREKERRVTPKSLLIDSVRDLIPREIYDRKKMGFELPMWQWMRGPLRQFTVDGLTHVTDRGLFTESQTSDLHKRFTEGKLPWQRLWAVVALGWYLQKHDLEFDQPLASDKSVRQNEAKGQRHVRSPQDSLK